MSQFKAGFARGNITPPNGLYINGYYNDRYVEGVLDELEANAVAFSCNGKSAVLITLDLMAVYQAGTTKIREAVSKATGLDMSAIFVHCTHTHVAPSVLHKNSDPEFDNIVIGKVASVAAYALADLKPAKLGWGISTAPDIAFVRRFRMKDGSVATNPGIGNPDIVAPLGDVDENLYVLRMVREGGDDIVIANFSDHPDTVGGSKVTGDWPGFARRTLEKALDNVKCVIVNGIQGDVNHIKVDSKDGDFNGIDPNGFDGVGRGYEHAAHMGRVVAGGILQIYTKVNFVPVDDLKFGNLDIALPTNIPTAEEVVKAKEILALHDSGRDSELPYKGMELTTVVAEATRMCKMEHGPDHYPATLSALALGPIAIVGIPGEPFTGVGRQIRAGSKYTMTLACCLVNGAEGYFPVQSAFDEGGYEARSSIFKPGVGEYLAESSLKLIHEM